MDQQPQVSIMSNTPDTVTDKKKRKSNSTPGKCNFNYLFFIIFINYYFN